MSCIHFPMTALRRHIKCIGDYCVSCDQVVGGQCAANFFPLILGIFHTQKI